MATYTVKESSEFVDVDDGAYEAVVESIEEVEGDYGEQFKFHFRIQTEGSPEVTAFCSKTLSTKSKLYQWACGILGHLEPGASVEIPEDLIGKPCRVLVANKPSKSDPDKWWPRIEKVGPSKPRKPQPAATAVEF